MAYIANYFLQGEVSHNGLPQWLAENTGLSGGSPDAVGLAIWINSNGGDVMAAIEAINLIKSSPIPVATIVNGSAESAALLILMSGHKRAALKNSFGMAHHFSTEVAGNYHELRDFIGHNKLLHTMMANLWKENSTVTPLLVEELMLGRQTTWMSAQELLGYGLIDTILEPGPEVFNFVRGRSVYGIEKESSPAKNKKRARGQRNSSPEESKS